MLHRRTIVSAAALLVTGAVPIARAMALSIEEPSEKLRILEASRCDATNEHASLIAEAEAAMQGRAVDPARRNEILRAITCPFCGCHPADPATSR